MIEVTDLLLDAWELDRSGMPRKQIARQLDISYSYVGIMLSQVEQKPIQRCRVNTTCRHKYATWWYWTMDGAPILTDLKLDKPHKTAVPCCDECAKEIWKRSEGNDKTN